MQETYTINFLNSERTTYKQWEIKYFYSDKILLEGETKALSRKGSLIYLSIIDSFYWFNK